MGGMITKVEVFMLILIRVSSLFIASPLFGRRNLPTLFKVGFSFLVALILVNVINTTNIIPLDSMYDITVAAMKEFLIGLMIGYVSFLIFSSIYLAGQLIDTQVGFGIASVIDPTTNIQVPVTANFYYILAMIVFLLANGHHMLIEGVVKSYSILPIGTLVFNPVMITEFIKILGLIFIIGFKISAPVIAAILVCDVTLGILSKTMPQMNIFFVGMPLKIGLGLVVMIITIPAFIAILSFLIDAMNQQTTVFLELMLPK
jgi:flagellar biosynthetic protein FliR